MLKCITHFYVQNEVSRQLLASLGITEVTVAGDTRFDRVLQIREQSKCLPIVEAFAKGSNVFVAGSSWPPDGDVFIPYFNSRDDWKLVIAPHEIGEDHLRQIEQRVEMKTVRYTQTTPDEAARARCLIIDCFGLLSSAYRYGCAAYVGGGFGVGIHNVLEAAVWGIPVIFGPNNKHFQEAQGLMAAGADSRWARPTTLPRSWTDSPATATGWPRPAKTPPTSWRDAPGQQPRYWPTYRCDNGTAAQSMHLRSGCRATARHTANTTAGREPRRLLLLRHRQAGTEADATPPTAWGCIGANRPSPTNAAASRRRSGRPAHIAEGKQGGGVAGRRARCRHDGESARQARQRHLNDILRHGARHGLKPRPTQPTTKA